VAKFLKLWSGSAGETVPYKAEGGENNMKIELGLKKTEGGIRPLYLKIGGAATVE